MFATLPKSVRIELHCHSVVSDGDREPVEIATRARDRGVALFALTDHDSLAGYRDTAALASPTFTVLRGVELSAVRGAKTVHLLLYGRTESRWSALGEYLERAQVRRVERLLEMGAKLAVRGLPLDVEAIVASARAAGKSHGRSVGRPDLARAMVEAGYVATPQDAFKRHLYDGSPCYVPSSRLEVGPALELGRAVGAKMSLAHPHTLGTDAGALLREHKGNGLEGVEVFYGAYPQKVRAKWLAVAKELGLVATGGSDYHGATQPQITELGVEVPPDRVATLFEWLGLQ